MSTDEREKQIREREAKATKGPWEASHRKIPNDANGMYDTQVYCSEGKTIATLAWYDRENPDGRTGSSREENCEFISHARADIPWLLYQLGELQTDIALRRAGAERLESELASARESIKELKDSCDYRGREWTKEMKRAESAEAALNEAVSDLRVLGEETVLAGSPGGDRMQTLANVRALVKARDLARKWVAQMWRYAHFNPSVRTALSEDGELKEILAVTCRNKKPPEVTP